MPAYDFEEEIFIDDDFVLPLELEGEDLTGATVYFTFGSIDQDSDGVDIDLAEQADGKFTITISGTLMTAEMEVSQKYNLRVQVEDSQGTKETVLYACIRVVSGDSP